MNGGALRHVLAVVRAGSVRGGSEALIADHAQRHADDTALLDDRLQRLRGVQADLVRLCCGAGFLTLLRDSALARYSQAHPGVTCRVALGGTDRILAAVAEGAADVGLACNPPSHPDLRSVTTSTSSGAPGLGRCRWGKAAFSNSCLWQREPRSKAAAL